MNDPLLDRHGEALDLFTDRVHAVRADQWGASTPCAEWSVRDLVNHLTAEQLWVPPLVSEGRTMAEVGDAFDGDVLGDDPVAAWDRAAAAARAAFAERVRRTAPCGSRTARHGAAPTARRWCSTPWSTPGTCRAGSA